MTTTAMLRMAGVRVDYVRRGAPWRPRQVLHAVNDVTLEIAPGESLGLVGESGSGKSTVARAIEGLAPVTSGSIEVDGHDVVTAGGARSRALRRRFQMVFQDPYSSLDPSMTVGATLTESLTVHRLAKDQEAVDRTRQMIEAVGLRAADLAKYPYEFSGGQRQRIAIARALMTDPDLLILDEAVSALDVSTRAQVLQLLQDLRRDRGLAFLFIGHDLAVVERMSDRIAVMYLGRIVEIGPARRVVSRPEHPYTASLLASVPRVRASGEPGVLRDLQAHSDPPDPWDPPTGCAFSSRCPFVMEVCRTVDPPVVPLADEGMTRCHLPLVDLSDPGPAVEAVEGWGRARSATATIVADSDQQRPTRSEELDAGRSRAGGR